MGSYALPELSRRLLATLVREYIATGEPVASQVLARESGLGLWVSNSSSGCRRELDQPPTVRDPTHTVEFGTGDGVSYGDA